MSGLPLAGATIRTMNFALILFLLTLATGLVWVLKLATDPFCDAKLYWRAPFALMRGETIDPLPEVAQARRGAGSHHR